MNYNDLDEMYEILCEFDWSLSLFTENNLEELKKKYAYDEINYSQSILAEKIRNKISQTLSSDEGEGSRNFFYKVCNNYLLSSLIHKNFPRYVTKIFSELYMVLPSEPRINELSVNQLREGLSYLKDYFDLYGKDVKKEELSNSNNRLEAVANSYLKLASKYSFDDGEIKDGDLKIPYERFKYLTKQLDAKMKDFGGAHFLDILFTHLENKNKFDEIQKRFHLIIHTDMMGQKREPTVPWGFLFNLAVKHPDDGNLLITNKGALWEEIIFDSTSLISLLDIEPFSGWDTENKQGNSVLELISDLSLLESNFKIHQLRSTDVMRMIKGLFGWKKNDGPVEKVSYSDINFFVRHLLEKIRTKGVLIIEEIELRNDLCKLGEEKIDILLDVFSHESFPNQDFISPVDYHGVNASFKPLIKISRKRYLLPCLSFSSHAFIEAISTYYRKLDKNFDTALGNVIEKFIHTQLAKANISFLNGDYIDAKKRAGEIDVSFETEDLLCFMEIKKKGLTRLARSGNTYHAIIDLYNSLLDSQYQALNHQVALLRDGKIDLGSKQIINHNKKIENISLVFLDFGPLQDRTVMRQILILFTNGNFRITSVDPKEQEKAKNLNDKCQAFLDLYNEYVGLVGQSPNIPFLGSSFFSLPQLLILLDNVQNIGELKESINKTKFVTGKTLDWYYEHSHMNKARLRAKDLGIDKRLSSMSDKQFFL